MLREIVQELNVKSSVIVADALHCQTETAKAITDAKADYLLIVKDNQPILREDIELLSHNKMTDTAKTVEKNGGRIETRSAYLTDNIETIYNKQSWGNVSCVGAIHREFANKGQISSKWRYYSAQLYR